LKPCLLKLHAELRDFDTNEVTSAADAYRSRGKADKEANVAAIEDHLRDLHQQRVRIERQVVAAWKERDPEGYAQAQQQAPDRAAEPPMFARAPAFYSDLSRQVDAVKTESAAPAQWKATIANLKGVKKDEIEWSGVNDWLDTRQGKVSKAEVSDFLAQNGVKVEETMLGNGSPDEQAATRERDNLVVQLDAAGYDISEAPDITGDGNVIDGIKHRKSGWVYPVDQEGVQENQAWHPDEKYNDADHESAPDVSARVHEMVTRLLELELELPHSESADATKFGQYTLPGGDHYRELLLTLPQPASRFKVLHFDQPNIVAHVRFDDRTDAEGKKVLFIEEIQSDWAQKGKREGFYTPADRKRELAIREAMGALAKDRDPATNRMRDEKGWHELAREREALDRKLSRGASVPPPPSSARPKPGWRSR
jgi:hypothetical protein